MSRMRELTEQYRAEAERIGALIDNLRADGGTLNSETRKRLDMLYTMRRENLATYRHLLDYCAAVDNKHRQNSNTYVAATTGKRVTQRGRVH